MATNSNSNFVPEKTYDVAVIGGGSGGFSAALAAARQGFDVLLVEAAPQLGGNSTRGGVNCWEPGIGGPGFHSELYDRLARHPKAIGVAQPIKRYTPEQPWAMSRVSPELNYRDSLGRALLVQAGLVRNVPFEPERMAGEMAAMLDEAGAEVRLNSRMVEVKSEGCRVTQLLLENQAGEREAIAARFFVDSTAQVSVARHLGCETYLGCEPQSMYDELGAPPEHCDRLNGVSLIFRVRPVETPCVEPLPAGISEERLVRSLSIVEYPNGDLNINPLPVMEGWEYHTMEPRAARAECERRVYLLWNTYQREFGFDRYRLLHMFPAVGVREGPRLIGRRVLTQNDILAGFSRQDGHHQFITLADHPVDVHGSTGHRISELIEPYGVPFDCLLPREFDNLAVACRGASFSHIAGASCRLSRTMMQLGHAAGMAVAVALHSSSDLPGADIAHIRHLLELDNVALHPDDERFPYREFKRKMVN